MTSVTAIREYIEKIPAGTPIVASSLRSIASSSNVRQVLCRMVKAGEIKRVARGIFVRPKENPYLGKVLPGSKEIVEAIAKSSGETIAPHGAEAARLLHLSTQVPMQSVFYTTGHTRHLKVGKSEIILKHISPKKLVKPGTVIGLVISALWYLGRENTNDQVIETIKRRVDPEYFAELFECTSYMPAWMANAFYHYKKNHLYEK